jgi:redox-sensitive bicupin YhaK (pirin superfamily)
MWVLPDTESIDPGYEQLDINPELAKGGLVPIASGKDHQAAISIRQKGAVLWGGRLKPGETVSVPDAPFAHLYIARGAAQLEAAGQLNEGDAVRLTAAGSLTLTADPARGAEVLIWEMDPSR